MNENKIIISKTGINYEKIYKLLPWNNLIVCVISSEDNQKKLIFLNLEDNDKVVFVNQTEKILDLTLEDIDNGIKLRDYAKST